MKSNFLIFYLKEINKIKFYLISIFCLNFIVFYFFLISEPKLFQTKVLLNSVDKLSIKIKNNPDLKAEYLYNDFLFNLGSRDNFINFLKEKGYQGLFNKYLNNKKISLEEYLEKNLIVNTNQNLIVLNKKTTPILIFNYPENINGHDILNEYVKYSFSKGFLFYINVMKDYNLLKLKLLEQKLIILTDNFNVISNQNNLVDLKFTTLQINNNLEELNKIDVNIYNPIIDKAFKEKNLIYPDVNLFITYGILSWLFVSILIISIRIFF